ncbi:MAG: hypothetical protein HYV09_25775 [Deltaproteobacteria bacterium]|nr:hypothetical protein [Deltaproteobacteria bacterium]
MKRAGKDRLSTGPTAAHVFQKPTPAEVAASADYVAKLKEVRAAGGTEQDIQAKLVALKTRLLPLR